ncbi:MAG TPA: sigma-70 family RNA polymerase sigma factor [Pirellulales bacterium]|jgi:RNA polymerase sigma-70 factor (ECF subfamily)|nr:sigma-70 family RNA polymerase sigma factor [Pirellulales bacterium]
MSRDLDHPPSSPQAADRALDADRLARRIEESALVESLRRGDREAFAQIVAQHQGPVYGFLRARLLQPTDAEDLAQEVFLRCYTARDRLEVGASLRAWLIGIARNLLRERARQVRRRKEVVWTELCLELDELTAPGDDAEDDSLVHLPNCMESLGDSARQAIEMRYCSQLRLAEIGNRLRRSEGAAKLLMFRARQALKSCLDHKVSRRHDEP